MKILSQNKSISLILKICLIPLTLISTTSNSFALPFHKNASSFQNWLNYKRWSGSDYRFIQLGECFYLDPDYFLRVYERANLTFTSTVFMEGYICKTGFVEISNPQGKKVCILDKISFERHVALNLSPSLQSEPDIKITHRNCRWR
jgi:hypothetical protein